MNANDEGLLARIWVIESAHSIVNPKSGSGAGVGAGLDGCLHKLRKNKAITHQDKIFAEHLLRLILKNKTRYDVLLQQFMANIGNMPSLAMIILYAGVAQIHHMNVPNYAAVNTCVELAKHYRLGKIAGLVNAVLKKVISGELCENMLGDAPEWLRSRLINDYGEQVAAQIWSASLADINYVDLSFKAELSDTQMQKSSQSALQGVLRKSSQIQDDLPEELPIELKGEPRGELEDELGGELHIIGQSLRYFNVGKITELDGYNDGDWWVQDLAASLPIYGAKHLLEGKNIIDLCAAPGGKTMQLAAFGGKVLAVDRSKKRLELLDENLQRTKLQAQMQHRDLLKGGDLLKSGDLSTKYEVAQNDINQYDFVVLDAPCSATGTLRRNPDILYQLGNEDIAKLCVVQQQLLQVAASMVANGGYLLYVVCSLFKQEGEQQIETFLQQSKSTNSAYSPNSSQSFKLVQFNLPSIVLNNAGQMRTLPFLHSEHGGMDGFFAALLQKIG